MQGTLVTAPDEWGMPLHEHKLYICSIRNAVSSSTICTLAWEGVSVQIAYLVSNFLHMMLGTSLGVRTHRLGAM